MALRVRLPIRLTDPFVADDDRALVRRFAESRDESAFAGLVSRHGRMVLGVCRRAVKDAHLAEDAFQAVFLVLARNPMSAIAASSVGGWLFGVARRVGLAARRHEIRQQKLLLARVSLERGAGDADFDDLLRVLDEELAAIPEACRAPLVACFLEERTQDEAAKQLGWSLSTLRRRLERGKELLRARLLRRGVTLAAGLFAGAFAPSARATAPSRLLKAALPAGRPSPLAVMLASQAARGTIGLKAGIAAIFVAFTLGGLALGLGGEPPSTHHQKPQSETGPATPPTLAQPEVAPSPRAVERKAWVTITGRVVFPEKRELPKPRPVPPESIKDAAFFEAGGPLFHRDVEIDGKTRGIANVVVWLRPDSNDRKATFLDEKIHPTLASVKPTDHTLWAGRDGFQPRVIAARSGDRLVFTNPTPIAFNVHYHRSDLMAIAGETGEFNILLPAGKNHVAKPLPALRSPDHYSDSIHPWVRGYVWAFDHPYFAVTDEQGNFLIKNAPPGSWRLVVWHEKTGYKGGATGRLGAQVMVADQGLGNATLEPVVLYDGWDLKD